MSDISAFTPLPKGGWQDNDSGSDGRFFSFWRNSNNRLLFSVHGFCINGFSVFGVAVMDDFGTLVKVPQ